MFENRAVTRNLSLTGRKRNQPGGNCSVRIFTNFGPCDRNKKVGIAGACGTKVTKAKRLFRYMPTGTGRGGGGRCIVLPTIDPDAGRNGWSTPRPATLPAEKLAGTHRTRGRTDFRASVEGPGKFHP